MIDYKNRLLCGDCGLFRKCQSPCLMTCGNSQNPKVLVITEAPSKEEDLFGKFLIGKSSKLIDKIFETRIENAICLTNSVKCTPYDETIKIQYGMIRTPTQKEIDCCRQILIDQIMEFYFANTSLHILILGKTPYQSLFNESDIKITQMIGQIKIFEHATVKVVTILDLNPAYIIRNPNKEPEYTARIRNVIDTVVGGGTFESGKKKLPKVKKVLVEYVDVIDDENTPERAKHRTILTPGAFAELTEEVLANAENIPNVIFDIEATSKISFKAKPIGFGFDFGEFKVGGFYVPIHLKDFDEFTLERGDVDSILQNVRRIVSIIPIAGHNLKYDISVLLVNGIMKYDEIKIFADTMILGHFIYNRTLGGLKLENLCSKVLGIKEWKDVTTWLALNYRFIKDRHFGNIPTRKLGEYCARDVVYNRLLLEDFMKKLPKEMSTIKVLMNSIIIPFAEAETKGIMIDEEMVSFLDDAYTELIERYKNVEYDQLEEVREYKRDFGSFSPKSPIDLKRIMFHKPEQKPYFKFKQQDSFYKGVNGKNGDISADKKVREVLELTTPLDWISHHKFLDTYNNHMKIAKLKSTYIDNVGEKLDDAHLYKPDYNLVGAHTGRLCLVGDTKISLFNGKEIRIDELPVNESQYLYGCLDDGTVIPVEAFSLGETKKVNKLIEVILDNGESIRCTYDHRFMIQDGSYKEAQLLKPEDSLMPLNYNHKIISIREIVCNNIPVFDISVSETNNFALSAGVFVHNSSGFHVLPRKSDVKRMFISRWRELGGIILVGDFSQIELRVCASLANETKWIKSFENDEDIHTRTGGIIYGIDDLSKVTSDMRKVGKVINFGLLFGKGIKSTARDLNKTIIEAEAIQNGFFSGVNELKRWIVNQQKFVRRNGYVVTPWNRVLLVPESKSIQEYKLAEADRAAINYPVQCLHGDTIIPLLDGSHQKIKDLDGKEVWTCSNDGTKIVPGKGHVFKSGEVNKLVKITLDNGESFETTDFHLWQKLDGSYCRADTLKKGDSLLSLYRKTFEYESSGLNRYENFLKIIAINHRVSKIEVINYDTPISVYDIEVPEYHNFAIGESGVFVHNSSSSDSVVYTISNIYKFMKSEMMRSLFIGSVHDSILYDVAPGELPFLLKNVKYYAETYNNETLKWIKCPVKMDFTLSVSWGAACDLSLDNISDSGFSGKITGGKRDLQILKLTLEKSYSVKVEVIEETEEELTFLDFAKDSVTQVCSISCSI
jgi:uracil-DNA glycosylase family 4